MKKVYKELTGEQKKREIVFSSCLSEFRTELETDTIHELTGKEEDYNIQKERLLNDSFFNNSYFKFNIVRG